MTLRLTKPGETWIASALSYDDGDLKTAVGHLLDWQHKELTHFYCQLFELLMRADEVNLVRLALAFPYHALAFEQWRYARTDREFFRQHGVFI